MSSTGTEDPFEPKSSARIKLSDGRHLAYREKGVPKSKSTHTIIVVHGFGSSKDMNILASQDLIDELGICFLVFDRAGYGGSDPNPSRSMKRDALDIEELADQLEIGAKFYLVGVSIGAYSIWSCLKYIPHRLAGVSLIVPVVNYGWASLPRKLIKEDYRRRLIKWALWFSKHTPGLLHWWVTRDWFSPTPVVEGESMVFNDGDMDVLKRTDGFPMLTQEGLRSRSVFDVLRNDFMATFGKWDFDPMGLSNPFDKNESLVHIWQGYEDKLVPFELQRHVSSKLPWIRYHEVPNGGHLIVHYTGLLDAILRSLLLGEEDPLVVASPKSCNNVEDPLVVASPKSCNNVEDPLVVASPKSCNNVLQ